MQVAWQAEDITLGYVAAGREAIATSVALPMNALLGDSR
jgi:hypothetical protein